jgi:hypothetical protein
MTSKSVSTTLDEKDYAALKALAKSEDRNISGQARHMLRNSLALRQTERDMEGMERYPHAAARISELDASEDGGAGAKGFLPDTSPDSTLGEQARAEQEPLPG